MKANILLIYPPSRRILREDRCPVTAKNPIQTPALPPMDLLYLAAVAEAEGCSCRIVDYMNDNRRLVHLIADLKALRTDYLVVSTTTPTLDADLSICAPVKRLLPDIQIIAKGAHFLKYDRDVLARYPALDFIIRGEAETTFQEIVAGKNREDIAGITWRGPAGIVANPDRHFIENLDALPFPARHLIDNARYRRPDNDAPQTIIKVSRGCPYRCYFCLATPLSGSKVRMRSPENIVAEIRMCVEQYGIRNFIFWSDIFNQNKEWVLDLCRAIKRSGLGITWSANTRADTMDREMADAMGAAGCRLVSIGVESGNQHMLDRMGKKQSLERVRATVSMLKDAGFSILAYYLIGLPWETRASAEDTVRFAIELDSDFASFFIAAPLPGTAYHEQVLEDKGMRSGSDGTLYEHSYSRPVMDGNVLNKEELARIHSEAVRRFHFRPGYILKRLRSIRSVRELRNYSLAALSLFRNL